MHAIAAVGFVLGGANLHAPQAFPGIEDEVIALAVTPGLGDAKAQARGLEHEGQFGALSPAFWRTAGGCLFVAGFLVSFFVSFLVSGARWRSVILNIILNVRLFSHD